MKTDFLKIRAEFPALKQKVHGKDLVYLDSAATTLKPQVVIDRMTQFYKYETANVHRGAHYLSDQATANYENARKHIQKFINAKSSDEIIFVRGTTEAINLVASSAGRSLIKHGEEIIISEMEHHANIVPWQLLAEQYGLTIKVIPVSQTGELLEEEFLKLLTPRTRILSLVHCSNALGTVNDVQKYIKHAHSVGAKVLIDGAQFISSAKVDVQDLDCDFYVFSGHKLFAPFGIGVLYGKREILENLPPYQGGGSMINEVKFDHTTFQEPPYKFEAGTPAIAEAIGLGAALEFFETIAVEQIAEHEQNLLQYATRRILEIPGIKIFGTSPSKKNILSFNLEGVHPSDIGSILDQEAIAIRCGHHCTQPLHRKFGLSSSARASFSIYNDELDVDRFISAVNKAKEMLL